MGGVEYQVTKVDPTDPETKGMVYQVHKVSEEVAATLGGKVYRARIIKDPSDPAVAGKVYQIVLIGDPSDPAVKGKVYNAILTGGSEVVVVGPAVSPLLLPDAIADSLTYVKAFGGTELRTSLPDGYTQLEYIESTGTQYITSPITSVRNGTFYLDFQMTETPAGFPTIWGAMPASSDYKVVFGSGSQKLYSQPGNGAGYVNTVDKDTNRHQATITTTTDRETVVIDDQTFANNFVITEDDEMPLSFFARKRYDGMNNFANLKLYRAWHKNANNVTDFDVVPVKSPNNVLGLYDMVSGTFYANEGTGDFVAGPTVVPTPDAPMNIVSNNGVLKYGAIGKNLFDKNHLPERITAYFANSGTTWSYTPQGYSLRFPCLPNTTYTARYNGDSSQAVLSFASTSTDDVPTSSQTTVTVTQAIRQNQPTINTPVTLTTGANDKWLIVQYNAANPQNTDMADNLQIELGSSATPYEPYRAGIYTDGTVETIEDTIGNTATTEMLLAIASDHDVQEIISGSITRKIGVKVLDGSENWANTTVAGITYYMADLLDNNDFSHLICTHFVNDAPMLSDNSVYKSAGSSYLQLRYDDSGSLAGLKQWLTDQYNAGTPVIVLYSLATPTTESVTGQTLQVQDGDNTLEITQASLTGLELEAEYEKESA